jgi:hypothetical protein
MTAPAITHEDWRTDMLQIARVLDGFVQQLDLMDHGLTLVRGGQRPIELVRGLMPDLTEVAGLGRRIVRTEDDVDAPIAEAIAAVRAVHVAKDKDYHQSG